MASSNEVEALVTAFNSLPRLQHTTHPTTIATVTYENHWFFTVEQVSTHPPGDLLLIINPNARLIDFKGPRAIQSLPTPAEQAGAIVHLLLQFFVAGIKSYDGGPLPGIPICAPWTWSTDDEERARAIEAALKRLGVRAELCVVQPATDADERVAGQEWTQAFTTMQNMMNTVGVNAIVCGGCKNPVSSASGPLQKCSRCRLVSYCSKKCQVAGWTAGHRKVCGVEDAELVMLKPSEYYNHVAHTNPAAKQFANSVKLKLPGCGGDLAVEYAIRRLVITGRDTPENLALLLGPNWINDDDSNSDDHATHATIRIEVLLNAPEGSSSYATNSLLDVGTPVREPRPASQAEAAKIQEVREMQMKLHACLEGRKTPTADDMTKVLKTCKGPYPDLVQVYVLAASTLVR